MRKEVKILIVFLLLIFVPVAFASFQGQMRKWGIDLAGGVYTFAGSITATDDLIVTDNTTQKGLVLTASTVSLTSPTVTFSAAGKGLITLTSDANQTGALVTGGTLNQVITIISGAGSNTIRFDDATSMAVGSNVTLTEAQYDVLTLICVSSYGDAWAAVSEHNN